MRTATHPAVCDDRRPGRTTPIDGAELRDELIKSGAIVPRDPDRLTRITLPPGRRVLRIKDRHVS